MIDEFKAAMVNVRAQADEEMKQYKLRPAGCPICFGDKLLFEANAYFCQVIIH